MTLNREVSWLGGQDGGAHSAAFNWCVAALERAGWPGWHGPAAAPDDGSAARGGVAGRASAAVATGGGALVSGAGVGEVVAGSVTAPQRPGAVAFAPAEA